MGRSPCCDKNGLKKGPWTPEEDMKLINYIQMNGPGNWRTLPKNAGLQRCGKSCRLRWTNYLRPDIKRGRFSFEEEETIIQLHSVLGNKWSAIAARLPGRTDNEIKNYWNTHIRKRLLRMGIDPVTHAPRLHFSASSLPQLNNLSNLLRLQTLLNPEALTLALSLLSSNIGENPSDILLQKLQESRFSNSDQLLQAAQQAQTIQPNNHLFENILNQEMPSGLLATSSAGHQSQSQSSQGGDITGNFSMDTTVPAAVGVDHQTLPASDPNFWHGIPDLSDNSSFQSMNSSSSNNSQNFGFDSVLSTPLSSPAPLMSPSAGLIPEDDKEAFCSNLLRFEIPEGLNFDDFM